VGARDADPKSLYALMKLTAKMLGDAGEHYVVSQIAFAGLPATKMPDGWEAYDLAVETGKGLIRVSVKTRSETQGWRTSRWFSFDERRTCDWIAFVFEPLEGPTRAWIMPFDLARLHGNKPTATRKDPHNRDISWAKLNREPLRAYEDNWQLLEMQSAPRAAV
jgi:hypothetical protein